ncbi:MAG: flagellar basal body P-ring formation chaperone FlgA [Blastocatellia bacterium]|nr:flagellar basal body P-ring formation chaperone FlgA [Blastocatellia bacterium]
MTFLVQGVLAFALSALAFSPLRVAADEPVVRVAAESLAQSDRLTLGDIAEVRASDAAVSERLRGIALGYAPSVGAVREIERGRILLAMAAAGFPAGAVRLEAPPVASVRRAGQVIALEKVREAVERATLADLRLGGATARLARLDLPPSIEAPAGPAEVRASAGGVRDLFAPFIVSVEIWQEGRVTRRLGVTAQVEAFAPVVVAARDLPARVPVRREDAALEVRRLTRSAALYLGDPARLRGASLNRPVERGEPITADLLTAEIVVKPGDAVRIVGESNRLQVMAAGEALTAGRIGDRIQVKNNQSKLTLQAIVVDEGLVRVRF